MISCRNNYRSQNHQSTCLWHDSRWWLHNSLLGPDASETLQGNSETRAQVTLGDIPQNLFKVSKDIGTILESAA